MLTNKRNLVKRYGKDAEKVLTGRAVKDAQKYIENMKQQDLKEFVRKTLMQEESSIKSNSFVNKAAKYLNMSADDIKNNMF
jgi:ribosomal protein L22